jgi:hypothetical protein
MIDVTEEINASNNALVALAAKAPGRWLRFNLLNRDGTGLEVREYYQSQLGLMPMQDFFNQVRQEVQNVVAGDAGFSLGELFTRGGDMEIPKLGEATGEEVNELVQENMVLIQAVLDLIKRIPDFELDVYCLALGVHRNDKDWVKAALAEPPYRGGLSIDEGVDIMRQFLRDNIVAVQRFFTEDVPAIINDVREILADLRPAATIDVADLSTGGTPSSTTSPDTQASPSTT